MKVKDKFTIRTAPNCTYIRCHFCNQSHSFCGKDIDSQLETFKREHSHPEPATMNKDRFVNSLLGRFGE